MKPLRTITFLFNRVFGQNPEICYDFDCWLQKNEFSEKLGQIGDETVVSRYMPENNSEELRFSQEACYSLYPRTVGKVKGARIFGAEGMIQLPDQSYLLQTVWYPQQLVDHPQYYKRSKPSRQIEGIFHPLIQYWSRSYYHWMTETLPLLHGLGDFLPASTRHIIPGPISRFQKESLRLLGIDSSRYLEIHRDESWIVDELVIAPPATTRFSERVPASYRRGAIIKLPQTFLGPFKHSPEGLRWVANKMITAAKKESDSQAKPFRKIYITRTATACRRLNEKDLAELFSRHDIKVCLLEEMSMIDQIRLFQDAEVVIAPHGAGLSNLMFCKPGTRVIEIFEPSVVRLCYWSISSIFGLTYSCLMGKPQSTGEPDPDISVDPNQIEAILMGE